MSQIIQLTVFKRNGKAPVGPTLFGFDVDDIAVPIKFNSSTNKSYFSTRAMRGTSDGKSESVGNISYETNETLTQIVSQSSKLVLLTVTKRRKEIVSNVDIVFNTARITENLLPIVSGTRFYYHEDGDPSAVLYEVTQTVAQIIASSGISGGFTALTYAQMAALMASATVKPGQHYLITDRGDQGIFVHGVSTTDISREGIRFMNVPINYNAGSIVSGQSSIGVLSPGLTTNGNSLTIWGGYFWVRLNGYGPNLVPLSDAALDPIDWMQVPKPAYGSTSSYYDTKQYSIIYDFANDWIERQWDGNGNEIGASYQFMVTVNGMTYNPVDVTDWNFTAGRPATSKFTNNKALFGVFNNAGRYIEDNVLDGLNQVIKNNKTNIISANTASVINNLVPNTISRNTILIDSLPATILKVIYNQAINQLATGNLTDRYEINITGLSTIDLTAFNRFIKEVYLLSGSGAIDAINLFANFPTNDLDHSHRTEMQLVRIYIREGTQVTFVNGTGANQPHMEGGVSVTLAGNNGDWIEFQRRVGAAYTKICQSNIGQYV